MMEIMDTVSNPYKVDRNINYVYDKKKKKSAKHRE